MFLPSTFHLILPLMFSLFKGTIRHCGEGTGKDNCGPFTAWPGVYGRIWRGWWEGESILSVQWEPCPNDSNPRNAGSGEGPSSRAPYHGPCWTGEKKLLMFENNINMLALNTTDLMNEHYLYPIRWAFLMLGNRHCWEPSPVPGLLWLPTLLQHLTHMSELSSIGIMSKLQVADFKQIILFIYLYIYMFYNSTLKYTCSCSGWFSAFSFIIMCVFQFYSCSV